MDSRKASQMATIKAVIVETGGSVHVKDIENDLASYQAIVGGYIEGVFGNVCTMYVNEEGILRSLPFNSRATLFANSILGHSIRLFGDVLILGTGDGDGSDTDVRPSVVDYFTKEH